MLLADQSADYLIKQLDAGADAVQIFDTWAGVLDEAMFERSCVLPVKRMVDKVRAARPNAKIIGFPKGVSAFLRGYRERTGVSSWFGLGDAGLAGSGNPVRRSCAGQP